MQDMHSGEDLTNPFCMWTQISGLEEVTNIDDLYQLYPKGDPFISRTTQIEALCLKIEDTQKMNTHNDWFVK